MISEKEYNVAVKEYTRNLYRYLVKSLRDEAPAQDLLQDCFLKFWNNRDKIKDPSKVKSWLFSVAHNALLNYLKAASRKTSLDDNYEAKNLSYEDNYELRQLLEISLNELTPDQRSIVLLRDLEGYNYQEIGEILQLSESQVKVYLFRARQKMKDSIQQMTAEYDKRR